ncbi:MAG: DUF1294 domain-containing protein [Ruminococcus sp.]|nr:DUF1294 domain-containing protein [Ruminococcus sp.]
MLYIILLTYLILISLISIVVTVIDKINAIRSKRRVSERALFILSVLGGSIAMYITMLIIRHKTRKLKFMLGIPLVILLQLCFALFIVVKI